jgi:outer membrane protein OmpA-like peptidoglycan-associated protein
MMRAESVKRYIITKYPEIIPQRLRVSGTGNSEKIMVGWKTFRENDSINFETLKK